VSTLNLFARSRRSVRPLSVGLLIAALWGFHAAEADLPGRAYFHLVQLNMSRPVSFNVLLEPAIIFAIGFLVWRFSSHRMAPPAISKSGVVAGLVCWFVAASLSVLLNWETDQVLITYFAVFVAGAVVYAALVGVELTTADINIAVAGLAIGALFPLVNGLLAFVNEWGFSDSQTVFSAYKDLMRMQGYEAATFGNRGNTAAFLVIIAPLLVTVLLQKGRPKALRLLCAATTVCILLNLVVIQVRAAFLTMCISMFIVWAYRYRLRRVPLLIGAVAVIWIGLVKFAPDIDTMMGERLLPVLTLDAEEDVSVFERTESIKEGWAIAKKNWLLGVGPGGGLTAHSATAAHQFQTQQAMELGILGFVGSSLFSIGICVWLARVVRRGPDRGVNDARFEMLIGPASFVIYAVMANVTFNIGYVNTWAVLVASMVALAPGFGRSHAGAFDASRHAAGYPVFDRLVARRLRGASI